MEELIESILKWWEKHEYDTTDHGMYNTYEEAPEFVVIAMRLSQLNNK